MTAFLVATSVGRRAPGRGRASRLTSVVAALVCLTGASASAQRLVDRVAARVNGVIVYQSDVRAAEALGVVQPGDADDILRQLVQRQLLVAEVNRFPPQEPSVEDVTAEVQRMARRVDNLDAVVRTHGLPAGEIERLARDTLRIQAYLDQRFGSSLPVSDEVALEYYRAHPDEFVQNGARQSFQDAQNAVRERAAAARRRDTIAQWLRDLETRADVVRPPAPVDGRPAR